MGIFVPMARDSRPVLNTVQRNVKKLTDGAKSVNAWATAHSLTQTTINRIVTGKMDPTSKLIEEIAKAVGNLEPWHLLLPGLDPKNPPLTPGAGPGADFYEALKKTKLAVDGVLELEGNTRPGPLAEPKHNRRKGDKR